MRNCYSERRLSVPILQLEKLSHEDRTRTPSPLCDCSTMEVPKGGLGLPGCPGSRVAHGELAGSLGVGGGECKTGRPQGAEEISCFGLGQRGRRLSLRKAGSAGPGAPSPHTAGRNPFPRSLFLDTAVNLRVHFLVKQHLYQMAWLSDAQEQLLRSTSGTWPASWCRHIHHQQSQ